MVTQWRPKKPPGLGNRTRRAPRTPGERQLGCDRWRTFASSSKLCWTLRGLDSRRARAGTRSSWRQSSPLLRSPPGRQLRTDARATGQRRRGRTSTPTPRKGSGPSHGHAELHLADRHQRRETMAARTCSTPSPPPWTDLWVDRPYTPTAVEIGAGARLHLLSSHGARRDIDLRINDQAMVT